MVPSILWIGLALGALVPAVLAATLARRVLAPAMLAWFVSPVPAYVALIVWEALARPPGVTYKPGTALYGFMLISPVLALPWALACLLGFGLGLLVRLPFRPRRKNPVATVPVAVAASALPPPPSPRAAQVSTPGWRPVHIGLDGDALRIGGLAVWQHEWRREGDGPVRLPHPTHPGQRHDYHVVTIGSAADPVRFAACELSNGVWGFFVRQADPVGAQGASQDGTLLYEHRIDGAHGPARPVAVLVDAGSGTVLADGLAWASSRVTPNADGTMFLRLRQDAYDVLLRIDPRARQFRDHGEAGPDRPLSELAAAAEQARQAILDGKGPVAYRSISPNGTIRVDLVTAEWSNTHWVNTPRVVALVTGRVVLDLWGTDWDATVSFPQGSLVRLELRRYRKVGSLTLEMDVARDTFRVVPSSSPEDAALTGRLAGVAQALEAASAQWQDAWPMAHDPGKEPWAAWRAGLLILAAAVVAVAGATVLSLQASRHDGDRPAPLAKLPDFTLPAPR